MDIIRKLWDMHRQCRTSYRDLGVVLVKRRHGSRHAVCDGSTQGMLTKSGRLWITLYQRSIWYRMPFLLILRSVVMLKLKSVSMSWHMYEKLPEPSPAIPAKSFDD